MKEKHEDLGIPEIVPITESEKKWGIRYVGDSISPVVTEGVWVKCRRFLSTYYKCSVCENGAFDKNFVYGANYCPICGVRMKGIR